MKAKLSLYSTVILAMASMARNVIRLQTVLKSGKSSPNYRPYYSTMKIKLLLYSFLVTASVKGTEFGSLTNSVSILTNLVFRLDGVSHDKGNYPKLEFHSDETVAFTLSKLGMPGERPVHYRALSSKTSFDIKLFQDNGREVEKTKLGKEWSQQAPAIDNFKKFQACKPEAILGDDIRAMLRPDELFVITNKGSYVMDVCIRMLIPITNGVPDAQVMNNSRQFAFMSADHFHVFTSPSVRVHVVKE